MEKVFSYSEGYESLSFEERKTLVYEAVTSLESSIIKAFKLYENAEYEEDPYGQMIKARIALKIDGYKKLLLDASTFELESGQKEGFHRKLAEYVDSASALRMKIRFDSLHITCFLEHFEAYLAGGVDWKVHTGYLDKPLDWYRKLTYDWVEKTFKEVEKEVGEDDLSAIRTQMFRRFKQMRLQQQETYYQRALQIREEYNRKVSSILDLETKDPSQSEGKEE